MRIGPQMNLSVLNLSLRYSIRNQSLGGLYDVIDLDTHEYVGDPLPWHEAQATKERAEHLVTVATALANCLSGPAET